MNSELSFSRLVPDGVGGSQFKELSVSVTLKTFAPPAQPLSVSELEEASHCGFLHLPVGWVGDMHPSPIRMWIVVLEGEMVFESSAGESRHISPGSALLLEDTTGQGHSSRVVSSRPVTLMAVRLPEHAA